LPPNFTARYFLLSIVSNSNLPSSQRYHQTTMLTVNQHRKRLRFLPAQQNITPSQFSRLRHLCTVKPPTTPPAIVTNHLIAPISVYVARKLKVKRVLPECASWKEKGLFRLSEANKRR